MFRRFAICTLGVAAGLGIGAATQPILIETLGYKTDQPVTEVAGDASEADSVVAVATDSPSVDSEKIDSPEPVASLSNEKTTAPPAEKEDMAIDSSDSMRSVATASEDVTDEEIENSVSSDQFGRDNSIPEVEASEPTFASEVYSAEVYQSADGILPYRILRPENMRAGTRYPLVVFLHGAGERGSDNVSQLKHAAEQFASLTESVNRQAFVIFPQCPTGQQWSDLDWSNVEHEMADQPTLPMEMVMNLMDDLIITDAVDESRIYAVGLSMGGYGVLDLVARRPSTFAAAVSCCGGSDCSKPVMDRLAKTPLYIVHGSEDSVVDVENSRKVVRGIDVAGGDAVYVELPGVGHDCWTQTFNDPQLFEWLFMKKRTSANSSKLVKAKPSITQGKPVADRKPTLNSIGIEKATLPPKIVVKKPKLDKFAPLGSMEEIVAEPVAKKSPSEPAKPNPREIEKVQPTKKRSDVVNRDSKIFGPAASGKTDKPESMRSKPKATKAKMLRQFDRLAGTWRVRRGLFAGKEIPQAILKKMSLRFENRPAGFQLEIAQGEKKETGVIVAGSPVLTDDRQVETLTIVSNRPDVGNIKAVYYFDDAKKSDQSVQRVVMIWNAPGQPAPASTDPASLPTSRIMWLEK